MRNRTQCLRIAARISWPISMAWLVLLMKSSSGRDVLIIQNSMTDGYEERMTRVARGLRAVVLAVGLLLACPLSQIPTAWAQPAALSPAQTEALNRYNDALNQFKSILRERRA